MLKFILLLLLALLSQTSSFSSHLSPRRALTLPIRPDLASSNPLSNLHTTQLSAVLDIESELVFDKTITSAKSALVVVDYSTTWCGPCKVIAPKFEELSTKYPDSVFLKVIGDSSSDASKLMKRESVRSVPAFHFFKDGQKVDVVNGANAEALEAAIKKHAGS